MGYKAKLAGKGYGSTDAMNDKVYLALLSMV